MRQFESLFSSAPRPVSPVADMAEHLREAFERDGSASVEALKLEGYDDKAIARFGEAAIVRAARRSVRQLDCAA